MEDDDSKIDDALHDTLLAKWRVEREVKDGALVQNDQKRYTGATGATGPTGYFDDVLMRSPSMLSAEQFLEATFVLEETQETETGEDYDDEEDS